MQVELLLSALASHPPRYDLRDNAGELGGINTFLWAAHGAVAHYTSTETSASASIRGLIAAYTPGPKTETVSEKRMSWVLRSRR